MDRYPYLGTLYYLTSVYLHIIGVLFYIFLHILNTKYEYAYQVLVSLSGKLQCFMLISIPSASLVLQTYFFLVSLVLFSFSILLWIFVVFVL